MKLAYKILILYLLLPSLSISSIIGIHFIFGIENTERINLFSHLGLLISHIIVIIIAIKINIIKINVPKIKLIQILISLVLGLILFYIYYMEFNFLTNLKKPNYNLINFLYAIIFAPILEEFFYKIILFNNLILLKINPYFLILITALLFSFGHLPNIYIAHFLLGLITTFIYFKNKSLIQSILIHSFYNLFLNIFYLL